MKRLVLFSSRCSPTVAHAKKIPAPSAGRRTVEGRHRRNRRRDRRGNESRDGEAGDSRRAEALLNLVQDHRSRCERRVGDARPIDVASAIVTSSTSRRASASARSSSTTATSSSPTARVRRHAGGEPAARSNAAHRSSRRVARHRPSLQRGADPAAREDRSAPRRGGTRPADVPAWTTEKPVVSEEQVLVPPLETLDELEARAKKLSAHVPRSARAA